MNPVTHCMIHVKNGKGNVRFVPIMYSYAPISHFRNVFKWMFHLLTPSDQPFHSPASFNVIFIAGMHLVVARSGKLRQALRSIKSNLSLTEYA